MLRNGEPEIQSEIVWLNQRLKKNNIYRKCRYSYVGSDNLCKGDEQIPKNMEEAGILEEDASGEQEKSPFLLSFLKGQYRAEKIYVLYSQRNVGLHRKSAIYQHKLP